MHFHTSPKGFLTSIHAVTDAGCFRELCLAVISAVMPALIVPHCPLDSLCNQADGETRTRPFFRVHSPRLCNAPLHPWPHGSLLAGGEYKQSSRHDNLSSPTVKLSSAPCIAPGRRKIQGIRRTRDNLSSSTVKHFSTGSLHGLRERARARTTASRTSSEAEAAAEAEQGHPFF